MLKCLCLHLLFLSSNTGCFEHFDFFDEAGGFLLITLKTDAHIHTSLNVYVDFLSHLNDKTYSG